MRGLSDESRVNACVRNAIGMREMRVKHILQSRAHFRAARVARASARSRDACIGAHDDAPARRLVAEG
jgi:hypothetical protein